MRPPRDHIACTTAAKPPTPLPPVPDAFFIDGVEQAIVNSLFAHLFIAQLRYTIPFKIDTGADISLIPERLISSSLPRQDANITAVAANGTKMSIDAKATLTVQFPSSNNTTHSIQHEFYIASRHTHRALLGLDFLSKYQAIIHTDTPTHMRLANDIIVPLHAHRRQQGHPIYPNEQLSLEPHESRHIDLASLDMLNNTQIATQLIPANQPITLSEIELTDDGTVSATLTNQTDRTLTLTTDRKIADLRPLSHADVTTSLSDASDSDRPTDQQIDTLLRRLKINLPDFNTNQQQAIRHMLQQNYMAFSNNGEMGTAKLAPIHIDFVHTSPVRCYPYRQKPDDSNKLHEIVQDMLNKGLLAEASGKWSSPGCLLHRNGKFRLITDYRQLNKSLQITNKAFLPSITQILQKITPGAYISSIDLSKAFWQFRITEESSDRLAIATDRGVYRPTRLPLGLTTSPTLCCFAMQKVLDGIPNKSLIHYVDDIAVFDTDLDKLITLTTDLLDKIKTFNLRINPDKTSFFKQSATILGHEIDNNGIRIPSSYTEKVRQFPTPQTPKQVKTFLGLATWCAKFFPYFAPALKILTPLSNCKNQREFSWSDKQDAAFQHLKNLMANEPCLTPFDPDLPIHLFTDASDNALSAVLCHQIQETFHPISFYSKCFQASELNQTIYAKEFQAIYAAIRHFYSLLNGQAFTLHVDNHAVAYLKSLRLSQSSPKIARYVTYLNQFDITVKAIKSLDNPADALSRVCSDQTTCETCQLPKKFLSVPFRFTDSTDPSECLTHSQSVATQTTDIPPTVIDSLSSEPPNMAELQASDPDIQLIRSLLTEQTITRPDTDTLARMNTRQRKLLTHASNYQVHNNVLLVSHKWPGVNHHTLKPVLPEHLYHSIALTTHASTLGHAGAAKVLHFIKSKCIAPGINKVVHNTINNCEACARQKAYTQNTKTPMRSNIPPFTPGAAIAIDHVGPFPTAMNYNYILTITDVCSKYVTLIPQNQISAIATARALLQHFKTFALPVSILSDNGRAFKNTLMQQLTKSFDTQHIFSTPYHPAGNGAAERANGTIKDLLTIACDQDRNTTWPDHLMTIQLVYNATVHSSTGYTPNFLQFGRELRLPNTMFYDYDIPQTTDSLERHALETVTRLRQALTLAHSQNLHRQKISKIYYDRNAKAINSFLPGQHVLLRNNDSRKLQVRYPTEFIVRRRIHLAEYEIQNCTNSQDIRKMNICNLKPFRKPITPLQVHQHTQTDTSHTTLNEPCIQQRHIHVTDSNRSSEQHTATQQNTQYKHTSMLLASHMPSASQPGQAAPERTRNISASDMPSASQPGQAAPERTRNISASDMPSASQPGQAAPERTRNISASDMPSASQLGQAAPERTRNISASDMPSASQLGQAAPERTRNISASDMPSASQPGQAAPASQPELQSALATFRHLTCHQPLS